jgi:hypothetical protein
MSDDVRRMYDNRYLGAWDLQGRDVTVTISQVVAGVIEGEGGRKDRAPVISFKSAKKPMICNKTNLKTISSLCGSFRASDWIGKRITLYATRTRGKAGGEVDCIRVRPQIPRQAGDSTIADVPSDTEMRAVQIVEAREPGED